MPDDFEGQEPGDLRDLVKKLQKQLKEAQDAAGAASSEAREFKLEKALSARKVPVKLGKFMGDVDPSDDDAVDGWLKDNADAFGFDLKAGTQQENQSTEPAPEDDSKLNLSEEEQKAFELMQVFQGGAASAPPDKVAKVASIPDPESGNLDDLYNAILAAGK